MKSFITISAILLVGIHSRAQKVFSVEYPNQADVKVFVVDYENQADLKVYKVKYNNQAGKNDGKWFFTKYANQAEKKVFFVDYQNQADLKIIFVDYENQAGWRNKSKQQLMYWFCFNLPHQEPVWGQRLLIRFYLFPYHKHILL